LSLLACCGLEYFSLLTAFPCCLPEIGTTERVVVPSFGSCGLMFSALRETSGVVIMKSGVEHKCTIQEIKNDTIVISQFLGRSKVFESIPINEVATYILNNHYSSPGEDLMKATGLFFVATGFMVTGSVVAVMALNADNNDLALAGTAFGLFGSVFLFSGYSKMQSASKKLNKLHFENDRIIYKL
jgi:hypothetical protein